MEPNESGIFWQPLPQTWKSQERDRETNNLTSLSPPTILCPAALSQIQPENRKQLSLGQEVHRN